MCRIAGIINPHQPELSPFQVRHMCQQLEHGGPDDEGLYVDADHPLVFGHRRLSLIDLSPGGHQPMTYEDGAYVISYNGELYNYLPIKENLQHLGYRFQSTSDTEVILAAFAAWGVAAFKRFAGMFAFALLDRRKGKVYLVRDQSGIKPLYYAMVDGQLYFASEVRALQSLPTLAAVNENWPVYFLAYGHLPEPVTTLRLVKPLPKGCYLEYNLETQTSDIHTFSHFSFIEKLDDEKALSDTLRQLLATAVERHLLSDAPIGAFLSGGIDSSLMALLAGDAVGEQLTTLSIFFEEQRYSEQPFQKMIAGQLRGRHEAFCVTQTEFDQSLPGILSAMDLPSNDGINTWFISKYARQTGLKAVLSGLGGDELFGGYPSFERMRKAAYLQQLSAQALKLSRFSRDKRLKRLGYLSLPGIKGRYLFLRGQFVPREIARQLNMAEEQVWQLLDSQPVMPGVNFMTYQNQASWMELNLYMQNQLLRDSDVMSMAHGLEIRVPFLDLDVVRFVLQIQSGIKYAGGGKRFLVNAFKDRLPEAIYNRPKMGFSFPFKEWLAANEQVRDELSGGTAANRQVYKEFLRGQRHWSQVLALLLTTKNHVARPAAVPHA